MLRNSNNNRNNQPPPLVIRNEYGSNLDILDVDFEDLAWFYEDIGLDLAQVLAEGPSAPKVDPVDVSPPIAYHGDTRGSTFGL